MLLLLSDQPGKGHSRPHMRLPSAVVTGAPQAQGLPAASNPCCPVCLDAPTAQQDNSTWGELSRERLLLCCELSDLAAWFKSYIASQRLSTQLVSIDVVLARKNSSDGRRQISHKGLGRLLLGWFPRYSPSPL